MGNIFCCSFEKPLNSSLNLVGNTNKDINNNPNVPNNVEKNSLKNNYKNLSKKPLNTIDEKATKDTNPNNNIFSNNDNESDDLEIICLETVIEKKDSDSLENNYKFLTQKSINEINKRNTKNTIKNNNNITHSIYDDDDPDNLANIYKKEGIIFSP